MLQVKEPLLYSPPLPLKSVLHVPKLSINLLSIHQVTKDLNYKVNFYPTYCVFQDRVTERMNGHAKEKNGLYFLKTRGGSGNHRSHSYLSVVLDRLSALTA